MSETSLLDAEGYPTEETLMAIRRWDPNDFYGLINFIRPIWWASFGWREKGAYLMISTGGWSGNEDIVIALQSNRIWWTLYWELSKRGGHYIFKRRKRVKVVPQAEVR